MASDSSSSTSSMSTLSSFNRMTGMMSGLDTESLVKASTSNTKIAINKRMQKLQKLTWKQESYRGVISSLSTFQNKYLDIISNSSIRANAVMKKFKAESSNSKLITTASPTATQTSYNITASKKATAAEISGSRAAAGTIELDFSGASSGQNTVDVTLDGTTRSVTFEGGANAKDNFLAALNDTFDSTTRGSFSFSETNGSKATLSFSGPVGDDVYHMFGVGHSDAVGLENDASSKISSSSKLGDAAFATKLNGDNFEFSINGKSFSFTKDNTIKEVMDAVNSSDAGVTLSFSGLSQSFTLKTNSVGAGQEIKIEQTSGNLINSLFNKESSGASSSRAFTKDNIAASTDFNVSVANTGLAAGSKFRFAIGDNEYSLDVPGIEAGNETAEIEVPSVGTVTANVREDADNNLFYDYTDDSGNTHYYKMGESNVIEEIGYSGNGQFFGADNQSVSADGFNNLLTDSGYFASTPKVKTYTDSDIEDAFRNALENAGLGDSGITLSYSGGVLTMNADGSNKVTAYGVGSESFDNDKNYTTGICSGSDVLVPGTTSLSFSDSKGNSYTLSNENGITVDDLLSLRDESGRALFTQDSTTGAFTLNGSAVLSGDDAGSKSFLNDLFGSEEVYGADRGNMAFEAYGTNSRVTINGITLENAGNGYTIDGTTFNFDNVDDFDTSNPEDADKAITVNTVHDTGSIKETVVNFINDFNALVKDLYNTVNTARPKSKGAYYEPLYEEQEEEMKDDEIEKWNEKAKTGLLYNDQSVNKVINGIRTAISTASGGMTLSSMGITLSKYSGRSDTGELTIDEDKLEAAIEQYGDEIASFFTDAKTGLGAKLNNAIDEAISTKANSYGYLTQLAGIENTASAKKNQMYSEMETIQSMIDTLNKRYESEQNRYWTRFTQLETFLSKMDAQSSVFMSG